MSLHWKRLPFLLTALGAGCGGSEPPAGPPGGEVNESADGEVLNLITRARECADRGELAEAVALCTDVLKHDGEHAEARLLRARAHLGLGQVDRARDDAEAIARLPGTTIPKQQQELAVLRGRLAVATERFDQAEQAFTQAIESAPEDAVLYEERALVRAVLEQHEAAIGDFTAGIERDPRRGSLYRWRAEEYFHEGRFDEALQDVRNAILLEPENPDYLLVRAHFQSELGLVEAALDDYGKAIALDPAPFSYYLRGNLHGATGNLSDALDDLNTAIDLEPERAEYYLARAQFRQQQGDDTEAAADFARAIESDPQSANAFQRRAGFFLARGEPSAAIEDLSAAIDLDPGLLSARRLRGIAHRYEGNFEDSVADFQSALETGRQIDDSMRAELLYQQGLTYQAAEEHERALEVLRQAIAEVPDLAAAHFSMAMSQGALLRFDEARNSLDHAVAADPESSEYLLARANLFLAEAQYQQEVGEGDPAATLAKAHADYQRAVEVQPEDDTAWYALAVSHASAGRMQESVQSLTKAIALNPDDARYHQARGDIRLQRQQYGSAIEDFSRAIELSPDNVELFESRGFAYGELGKREEANADFEKAEQLSNQDSAVAQPRGDE